MVMFFTALIAVSLSVACWILLGTTPATIHPLGILMLFLCMFSILMSLLVFFYAAIIRLGRMVRMGEDHLDTRSGQLVSNRIVALSAVLAFGPIVLIAINTISSITYIEIILVVLFQIIAAFYVWRKIH